MILLYARQGERSAERIMDSSLRLSQTAKHLLIFRFYSSLIDTQLQYGNP